MPHPFTVPRRQFQGLVHLIVLGLQFYTADSLYCLSCAETISPLFCETIKKCPDGEVCFTERYKSINNQTYYTTGCYTPRMCRSRRHSISKRKSFTGVGNKKPLCVECCTKDGCNSQGCSKNGPSLATGPLCFNCQQSLHPSLCHRGKVCQVDQVCHIHEVSELGVTYFTSSCLLKGECGRSMTDVFGKRAVGKCNRCCSSNLCNSQCMESTTVIPTTLIQMMTSDSTATTNQLTSDSTTAESSTSNSIQTIPPYTTIEGLLCFLVFMHLVSTIDALYCLSCAKTISPLFCKTIKKCPVGEICFTEMYRSINNQTYYSTGCYTPRVCRSKRHSMKTTREYVGIGNENPLCIKCCTKDGCNSQGCVNSHPQSLGPLCFNCKQSLDPSLCDTVQTCQADQVCHIHEVSEFGVSFFTSSCLLKGECGRSITDVLGKRGLGTCNHCCSTNLCNSQCKAATTVVTTTSSPTSTESTTKTPSQSTPTFSTTSKSNLSFDCWDLYNTGEHNSGVYTIYPWDVKNRSVDVYCDMDTSNTGFTVFQRRLDGTLSFDKTWEEYSDGFGNASSEYWLGNEVIHRLTSAHANKLYIIIEDKDNNSYYETYDRFAVAEKSDDYRLSLTPPMNGTAGEGMLHQRYNQNGQTFKTPDHDNSNLNCASRFTRGGWWFEECYLAYLNGEYGNSHWVNPWSPSVISGVYFKSSVMMITRTEY